MARKQKEERKEGLSITIWAGGALRDVEGMEGGRLVTIQSSQILINIKGVGATLLMLFVTRGSEPLEELRPLRLCGSGGRKEREGSERVGHTDSRGEILFQTNNKRVK